MRNETEQKAILLQAVADPSRLRLLKCLQVRPLCVCELVQATGMPQSRVSRHLKILRDTGLVIDQRDAQWVVYSLADEDDRSSSGLLRLLAQWLENAPEIAADRKALKSVSRRARIEGTNVAD